MRRRALVTATVTMLSLVAFTPASSALPRESSDPDPTQRIAVKNIKWEPCFQQPPAPEYARLECAALKAPLDWKKPNGKKITLHISRLKALKQAKGVVFTNPGGPGGPGWATPLMFIDGERNRLLDTMDIIGIDVRGTGYSTQATCKNVYGPYLEPRNRSAANTKRLLAEAKKFAKACQNSGNKRLPSKYVTTAQTVYDLEWIRRNLKTSDNRKVNKIHWVGYSAGTWLGAYYARKWPKRTGRFVLDSVVDFTSSWRVSDDSQPKAFQKRFGTFARWAAEYNALYGLGASQQAVVNRYERIRAAIAKSGKIRITDANGMSEDLYATELDSLIGQAIYSKNNFIPLAQTLDFLSAVTLEAQARSRSQRLALAVDPDAGQTPTYFNITCNDTAFGRTPAKHAAWTKKNGARYPLAGYAQIGNPCSQWKRSSGQLKLPRPVGRGLPKLLLIQSVGDPATPYGEAVRARKRYKNSRLVTVRNEGDHAIYGRGNACVDNTVDRYLIDGVYPKRDSSCQGLPLPVPGGANARTAQQFDPLQRLQELGELTRN
ncbi:alpha/beta hydrolase [Actinocorallia populi]|uniref:alpha/beta hydrolase n=1 Tax=Actinocorallia populi TaxID=2079200 RepID=UPI000D08E2EA|nr:alpha/beta hydrolase [Actinocorallia populi]